MPILSKFTMQIQHFILWLPQIGRILKCNNLDLRILKCNLILELKWLNHSILLDCLNFLVWIHWLKTNLKSHFELHRPLSPWHLLIQKLARVAPAWSERAGVSAIGAWSLSVDRGSDIVLFSVSVPLRRRRPWHLRVSICKSSRSNIIHKIEQHMQNCAIKVADRPCQSQ